MTLRQLEFLKSVADHGTISAAAEYWGVTQPAITNQIMQLEDELGTPLLVRKGRGVKLTESGAWVVSRAQKILDDVHQIPQGVAKILKQIRGHVTLGVSPLSPVSVHHFPKIYRQFHRTFSEIHIEVIEAESAALAERVRTGQVELALTPLPVFTTKVQFDALWAEELVVIAAPDDDIHNPVSLADLRYRNFVFMKPGYGLNHTVSRLVQKGGFVPRVTIEANSVHTLLGFVASGMGIAVVPRDTVTLEVESGFLKAVSLLPPAYRRMALVYREDQVFTPAASALAQSIREYSAGIGREHEWIESSRDIGNV